MAKTINFSKIITVTNVSADPKQTNVYNLLIAEMQQVIVGRNMNGQVWQFNKEQNTDIFKGLWRSVAQYATGLFKTKQGFDASIPVRLNMTIGLELTNVSIEDYDFGVNATFQFYFQSAPFKLVENFGSALLLKQNLEDSASFIVDIDDKSISITEYITT